jgi:hypothetical protein
MRFAANLRAALPERQPQEPPAVHQTVCDRIEVCDGRLASIRHQAPSDLLFGTSKFEHEAVVAHALSYSNPMSCGPASRDWSEQPAGRPECYFTTGSRARGRRRPAGWRAYHCSWEGTSEGD